MHGARLGTQSASTRGMSTDGPVLDKLHRLATAAGADVAWVAEVADANGVPCFGRVWVTPSYHPEASRIRGMDGQPIPDVDQVLRPSTKALDEFARDQTALTGLADNFVHFQCQGLQVRARVGLGFSGSPGFSPRARKVAFDHTAPLLSSLPPSPVPSDGELVLLLGPDGSLLYIGGETKHFLCWQDAVERLGPVLETGGPAVLHGAAVSLQTLDGPDGAAHLVTLRAARPVTLSPEVLLTPTQREVAGFAAEGATVKEIAQALGRHVETVRTHLRDAYRRLDVASRIDLARTLSGDMSPFVEL